MCNLNCLTPPSADSFVPAHQRWDDHPAIKYFEPIKVLGAGSFSQVVLARHRSSGRLAALKIIFYDNPNLDPETETMLRQEGDILMALKHPNIVGCSDIIKGRRADVLVLEYLRGYHILDGLYHISDHYTERDAAGIFAQVASAVAYLHAENIIHRDIKPENIVYTEMPHLENTNENIVVKIVDFGMAWRCSPTNSDKGVLGSAGFVAPELLKGTPHTKSMDIFSMGVLLFVMLVGRKPFNISDSENLRYAKSMPLADAPGFKDPRWMDLSPDAKHLLMGMLSYDPKRRLTAEQVMQHDWVVTCGGRISRKLGVDVALGAATVAEMRRLRFLCNGVVALQRAVHTVADDKKKRGKEEGHGYDGGAMYSEEFRRMQKRETLARDGSTSLSLRGIARSITARSFRHVHDESKSIRDKSVHMQLLELSSIHAGAKIKDDSNNGIPSSDTSILNNNNNNNNDDDHSVVNTRRGGMSMTRSNTALLLSELLSAVEYEDGSVSDAKRRNNSIHGTRTSMHRSGSVVQLTSQSSSSSGLQLLGASLRHYMDVTVRGSSRDPSMHSVGGSRHTIIQPKNHDNGDDALPQVVNVRRSLDDGSGRNGVNGSIQEDIGSLNEQKRRVHSVKLIE